MSDDSVVKYDDKGIADGSTVGLPRKMSRDIWLREVFPEWGSYLNQEIDQFEVKPGTGVMWYFGGPSFALKSQAGAVFLLDVYSGSSMFTDYSYCGVCRTSGADKLWWIRINPHVIDPWKFKRVDALCVTHHHQDHLDFYTISAALQTTQCKFIAPPESARRMKRDMAVPEERIIVAKVGQSIQIEDMKIDFAPNFDVIASKTGFETPAPFEEVAVSYIFNTQGGGIAFLGDSLYHNGYRMVGEKYKIDVVCMNMGNNAPGYTDKSSPWDLWRVAEALNAKVVVPDHFDNWGNCHEDPTYLDYIISRKSREKGLDMQTVTLLPGARYVHPDDMKIGRYAYPDWRERMNWKKSVEYGPESGQ
ncbi:MAG: ascorbate 6-phosphate lactonase [Proteobacteria bacterium]|nr:ascorbate 6-phosphate lactonase [Pseudomonadota bacterium]